MQMTDSDTRHAADPIRLLMTDEPRAALVLCHGRGATPESLTALVDAVVNEGAAPGLVVLAPVADEIDGMPQWYPNSFLAPLEKNEPYLSAALAAVGRAVDEARGLGLDDDHIVLGGFSQGACLAVEYAVRNARRWGGVAALSGALIGTAESDDPTPTLRGAGGMYTDKRLEYDGSLDGTPVLVAASERDAHIPVERLRDSADTVRAMDGDVRLMVFPGSTHSIMKAEVDWLGSLIDQLT